jgi:hypothetical protein
MSGRRKLGVSRNGQILKGAEPVTDADANKTHLALRVAAVVLMLAGAVLLVAGLSAGIAFPLITIGIAITVVLQNDKRRRHGTTQ